MLEMACAQRYRQHEALNFPAMVKVFIYKVSWQTATILSTESLVQNKNSAPPARETLPNQQNHDPAFLAVVPFLLLSICSASARTAQPLSRTFIR
jgi:hypothetical protein